MKKASKRKLTADERRRVEASRRKTADEKDSIIQQGRLIRRRSIIVRRLLKQLVAIRNEQGVTLTELANRTGMSKPALSRFENNEDGNPQLSTLIRYADALGKRINITVE